MKDENQAALRYILQEDIYLLQEDKIRYTFNLDSKPLPEIITPALNFNYLGNNKKNFLILVNYPDQEIILDTHLTALENVLKRIELILDDVAILNSSKYSRVNMKQLAEYFKPVKVLLLGKTMIADFPFLELNVKSNINSIDTLTTFDFDEMMSDNEKKRTFWEQVKTL